MCFYLGRTKYAAFVADSTENLVKAQRQLFDILKILFESATCISKEMMGDKVLVNELFFFMQTLNGDIRDLYLFVSFAGIPFIILYLD